MKWNAIGLVIAATCVTCSKPAFAALGQDRASVEADRAHIAASRSTVNGGAYSIEVLALKNQGVVKEYVRSDGVVFAVAWSGPGRPDLRQILGEHFATFQADNRPVNGRRIRRPLVVNRSELIVRSAGHPGAFQGFALLPAVAPPNFSPSELR